MSLVWFSAPNSKLVLSVDGWGTYYEGEDALYSDEDEDEEDA